MASQFKTDYFTFNGIDSQDYGFRIVTAGSSSSETTVNGLTKTLNEESGIGDLKQLISTSYEYQDFEIQICKMSGSTLLPITDSDTFFINAWLMNVSGYKALEYDGLCVYGMFTKGSNFKNTGLQGYFNLTFHAQPYARSNSIMETVNLYSLSGGTATKEIILENKSNVGEELELSEININLENATEVVITNLTTGKAFRMSGLTSANEKQFTIFCDGLHYIQSDLDQDLNMLKYVDSTNKNFLSLVYGVNRVSIKVVGLSANTMATVTFKYQCKVQYQ